MLDRGHVPHWNNCSPLEQFELMSDIASLLHPKSLSIIYFYPSFIYQTFVYHPSLLLFLSIFLSVHNYFTPPGICYLDGVHTHIFTKSVLMGTCPSLSVKFATSKVHLTLSPI